MTRTEALDEALSCYFFAMRQEFGPDADLASVQQRASDLRRQAREYEAIATTETMRRAA